MKRQPITPGAAIQRSAAARRTLSLLRDALVQAKEAAAPKVVARIRRAIKSAEGADRHAHLRSVWAGWTGQAPVTRQYFPEGLLFPYRLPEGQIVLVDDSAAKGLPTIGFTLKGGACVDATRLAGKMLKVLDVRS